MDKLKIGDKVRIKNVYRLPFSIQYNNVGDIIEYLGDGKWKMKDGNIQWFSCESQYDYHLELVEPKPKFKVGDRVMFIRQQTHLSGINEDIDLQKIYKVSSIGSYDWSDGSGEIDSPVVNVNGYVGYTHPSNLRLIEEECGSCAVKEFRTSDYKCDFNEPTTSSIKKSGNIMSKLTSFVKNSLLSADEKLLRKYSLKDDCGEYTSEAEVLVQQKLIKDNEAYLIEVATAMEAEEKKNK